MKGIGNDITAFHEDQKDWAEDRAYRPKILFQVMPPKDRKSLDPEYDTGIMKHAGRMVLDPDNRPVRGFREIPLVLSSKFEGWAMEAIRRQHSRITSYDFRARMPRDPSGQNLRLVTGKWPTGTIKDTLSTANALSMRQSRFRENNRCIAWGQKAGSKAFELYLWSKMTKQQKRNNSIEDMSDVEDKAELEKMRAPNKGRFGSRGRKRTANTDDEGEDEEFDTKQPPAKRTRKTILRKSESAAPTLSSAPPVSVLSAPMFFASVDAPSFNTPPVNYTPTFLASPFILPTMLPPVSHPSTSLGPALPASTSQLSTFKSLDLTPSTLPTTLLAATSAQIAETEDLDWSTELAEIEAFEFR